MKLSKLLTSKILLGIAMLAFVAQTFAATMVAEKLSPVLKGRLERENQALRTLAQDSTNADALETVQAAVRDAVADQTATVTVKEATAESVTLEVARNGQPSVTLVALLLAGSGVQVGPAGEVAAPPAPGGSAFGEHDEETITYVQGLLGGGQAQPIGGAFPDQQDSLRQALTGLSKTLGALVGEKGASLEAVLKPIAERFGLPLEALVAALTKLDALSNIDDILSQALVVDDPNDRFLVNFVEYGGKLVPVFEKNFLTWLLTKKGTPEKGLAVLARLLMHEDAEPRVDEALRGVKPDLTPKQLRDASHAVIAAIQAVLAGESLAGEEHADADVALLYRLERHEDKAKPFEFKDVNDLERARTLRAYLKLSPAVREEIERVAALAGKSAVGVTFELSEHLTVYFDGEPLNAGLSEGVRLITGHSPKPFLQGAFLADGANREGVELTSQNVRAFLIRAALASQSLTSLDGKFEKRLLEKKINRGEDVESDPRVAIVDVDALVGNINYNDVLDAEGNLRQDATLKLSKIVAQVGPSLHEKLVQLRGQKGDLTFIMASNRLPKIILDYILQAMDATEGNLVAVSFKKVEDLMTQVTDLINKNRTGTQPKFEANQNNVLFYIAQGNEAAYSYAAFAKPKILTVEKAKAGQRVSIALLLAGVELLYSNDPTAALTQLKAIYLEVVESMKKELNPEDYDTLIREAGKMDRGIIPAVPILDPDQMIQGVSDSMATAVAASHFA